jgi:hypothetical protein
MADISSIFILLAVLHGDADAFSLTELATFTSSDACSAAAQAFNTSIEKGGTRMADIGCVPATAFEQLRHN